MSGYDPVEAERASESASERSGTEASATLEMDSRPPRDSDYKMFDVRAMASFSFQAALKPVAVEQIGQAGVSALFMEHYKHAPILISHGLLSERGPTGPLVLAAGNQAPGRTITMQPKPYTPDLSRSVFDRLQGEMRGLELHFDLGSDADYANAVYQSRCSPPRACAARAMCVVRAAATSVFEMTPTALSIVQSMLQPVTVEQVYRHLDASALTDGSLLNRCIRYCVKNYPLYGIIAARSASWFGVAPPQAPKSLEDTATAVGNALRGFFACVYRREADTELCRSAFCTNSILLTAAMGSPIGDTSESHLLNIKMAVVGIALGGTVLVCDTFERLKDGTVAAAFAAFVLLPFVTASNPAPVSTDASYAPLTETPLLVTMPGASGFDQPVTHNRSIVGKLTNCGPIAQAVGLFVNCAANAIRLASKLGVRDGQQKISATVDSTTYFLNEHKPRTLASACAALQRRTMSLSAYASFSELATVTVSDCDESTNKLAIVCCNQQNRARIYEIQGSVQSNRLLVSILELVPYTCVHVVPNAEGCRVGFDLTAFRRATRHLEPGYRELIFCEFQSLIYAHSKPDDPDRLEVAMAANLVRVLAADAAVPGSVVTDARPRGDYAGTTTNTLVDMLSHNVYPRMLAPAHILTMLRSESARDFLRLVVGHSKSEVSIRTFEADRPNASPDTCGFAVSALQQTFGTDSMLGCCRIVRLPRAPPLEEANRFFINGKKMLEADAATRQMVASNPSNEVLRLLRAIFLQVAGSACGAREVTESTLLAAAADGLRSVRSHDLERPGLESMATLGLCGPLAGSWHFVNSLTRLYHVRDVRMPQGEIRTITQAVTAVRSGFSGTALADTVEHLMALRQKSLGLQTSTSTPAVRRSEKQDDSRLVSCFLAGLCISAQDLATMQSLQQLDCQIDKGFGVYVVALESTRKATHSIYLGPVNGYVVRSGCHDSAFNASAASHEVDFWAYVGPLDICTPFLRHIEKAKPASELPTAGVKLRILVSKKDAVSVTVAKHTASAQQILDSWGQSVETTSSDEAPMPDVLPRVPAVGPLDGSLEEYKLLPTVEATIRCGRHGDQPETVVGIQADHLASALDVVQAVEIFPDASGILELHVQADERVDQWLKRLAHVNLKMTDPWANTLGPTPTLLKAYAASQLAAYEARAAELERLGDSHHIVRLLKLQKALAIHCAATSEFTIDRIEIPKLPSDKPASAAAAGHFHKPK